MEAQKFKTQLERCSDLLKWLRERPLNSMFADPVNPLDDGFEDYFDVIKQPMDFSAVGSKLADRCYSTAHEWYNDICLIYKNAMTFHPPDSLLYQVAEYNLAEFKAMALGMGCSDTQQWYDLVNEAMAKLSRTIASGPVPQGTDPLVLSIIQRDSRLPDLGPESLETIADKINARANDRAFRNDLLCLLRKTEPNLKSEG
jgi:hypothetical protein